MDNIDFDFHLAQYVGFINKGNAENDKYFTNQAKYMHSLVVQDALSDVMTRAVDSTYRLQDKEAQYYILYGVARRLRMMWTGYREVLSKVAVDREHPLPIDDVGAVSRDLNAIYIDIRGTLDNWAWCLRHELGTAATKALHEAKIGLFSKEFLADQKLCDLRAIVHPFRDWHRDMKERRDPAAHRIPLSVIPAYLNPAETEHYREIERQIGTALSAGKYETMNELREQQAKIGTFVPSFAHHPDEGAMWIYPTVPQDIANLIKISRQVIALLDRQATEI